ncbi:MAG: hypothetical protein IKX06_04730 [Clostridia bacterium]|nr:hypothetical protein [Clostridia bacterium]
MALPVRTNEYSAASLAFDPDLGAAPDGRPSREQREIPVVVKQEPQRTVRLISDTETYRMIRESRAQKLSAAVSGALLFAFIVLGVLCVMRYASIFDLTRNTRLLVSANTKAENQLILDEHEREENETADVESIAARLGMVRATERNTVEIDLGSGAFTSVYSEAEDEATESGSGFLNGLKTFLGRIDYKEIEK